MIRFFISIFLVFIVQVALVAQIINGQDTLYGNEWIQFDQSYFKILVAEDGIYRVNKQDLLNAGMPIDQITGDQLQVFHNGEEIPIYSSTNAIFSDSDYFEFYGKKNRSELDRYLYVNPEEEMINPYYSLFTDTSAYFLTWTTFGIQKRYEQIANDLTNLPPNEAYYMAEKVQEYHNAWAKEQNSQGVSLSNFTMSEGYSTSFQNVQEVVVSPTSSYSAGPKPQLQIRYSGNLKNHQQLITLNSQPLMTDEFYGYEVRQHEFEIENTLLNSDITIKLQGLTDGTDRQRIGYVKLNYSRIFDFENASIYQFKIPASSEKNYLEINNFNVNGNIVLYDVKTQKRLIPTVDNSIVKISLPPSSDDRELVLINELSGIKTQSLISPVSFIDYSVNDANFIFLTNSRLFNDGNGNNYVEEYSNYRSSLDGGSFETIIVDIQQVYDQFGWGINRHSLSIRNFAHYIKKNWSNPQYFFIVGKGREYTSQRTTVSSNLYVPTFGVPGSDNQLMSTNYSSTPIIPVGRLAVVEAEQVADYLRKVKDAGLNSTLPQTIMDKGWMKEVLHLGGGDANIQGIIRNHLFDMGNELQNNAFGANIHSYFKNSSDPIQISRSEEIFNRINSGVSIVTFFGHSGANTFDFSLDSPDNYQNHSKYPLFFSLGCYSGQLHGATPGVSERFVFAEDRGAIAFIASTGQGYVSALRRLCFEYYHQLGNEYYGKGIGEVLKRAIQIVEQQGIGGTKELLQQFTLHGDPAFVLYAFPGADFLVSSESAQFNPGKVNIELDSFNFSFDIRNIGKHVDDSLVIEIRRELPNGVNIGVLTDIVEAPPYKSKLDYRLPTLGNDGLGLNRFFVNIDATGIINELPSPSAESNNELLNLSGQPGVTSFFYANNIRPVYPKEFAIIGNEPIVLKASTANTFAETTKYIIQIDTTQLFNSGLMLENEIEMSGGVLKWQPTMNYQDNTVYYWRVSPDSIDAAGFAWRTSSFLYLSDAGEGWNQSHYFQFGEDMFSNLALSNNRQWKFPDDFKDIQIVQGTYPIIRPQIAVNNDPHRYIPWDGPIQGGVMIMVLDSITVNPWINYPTGPGSNVGQYGSNIPSWADGFYAAFPYTTRTPEGRKLAMNFIDSIIPSNNYVVLITVQEENYDYEPEEWAADSLNQIGKNLFNVLESYGAQLIRQSEVTGAKPYYFIFKKDDPTFQPFEGFSEPDEITQFNFGLQGSWDNGYVETREIGPAQKWHTVKWNIEEINLEEDSIYLEIIGIKQTGEDVTLVGVTEMGDVSIEDVDAEIYPRLKLRFYAQDTTLFTPPQLTYWRVLYDEFPEIALNPSSHFIITNDTIEEGQNFHIEIGVENLGSVDIDSLHMRYELKSNKSGSQHIYEAIGASLKKGESQITNIDIETKGFDGGYQFLMEANPFNVPYEEIRFNNVGLNDIFVETDQRNPLLDVYFDGYRILDGDLVSSRPFIQIKIRDENQYLPLNDTSLFNVFLIYPGESELRRVSLSGDQVNFTPAELSDGINEATIWINATFEQDGDYQLIVQSKDVTGNSSGQFDYKVTFKVITKASISNVLNYPNPFSTSTRFLYTLTGHEAPARYKLQILTASGRIVREITQEDLGLLKPGVHLADFEWDGTDEFGDKLANGVYLYRFSAQNADGSAWEKYDNGTDGYFKSGYGKMVIVR